MHIEGLKNQQIKNGELKNLPSFGAKPVTRTIGRQVTDKAMKVLSAASAAITAAGIALSKKEKVAEKKEQQELKNFISNVASDKDLAEIHKIDLEAFSENYGVYSDFKQYKKDLEEQNVTTYAIKSQDGDVVGYYQLEPIDNGELYVYSMALRKDLRCKRASVKALNLIKESVLNTAIEKNADKIALDVESGNEALIKLYKRWGFEITDSVEVSTPQGMRSDHYMEIDVKKYLSKSQEINQEKPIEIDYSKLSDEEIEEIEEKIRQNPSFQKEILSKVKINKLSLPIVLKFIENHEALDELLKKDGTIRHVVSSSGLNEEKAQIVLSLIDKFLNDKNYKKLSNMLFEYLLLNVSKSSQVLALDRVLADEEFSQNEDSLRNMVYISTKVAHEKQLEVFNRILDNKKMRDNFTIMCNIINIIRGVKEPHQPDSIMECLNNDRIVSSRKRLDMFLQMLTPAYTQEQLDLIVKVLTDDRLYDEAYLEESGYNFIHRAGGDEAIKVKKKFIEKYLSDKKYYENECFKSNFLEILWNVDKDNEIEPKMYMVDKVLSDERIYKNKSVIESFVQIINYAKLEYKLRAQSILIDNVLLDEEILKNPILEKCLGTLLAVNNHDVYSKEQIKTLLRLFEAAFEKKNILKVAGEDISDDEICQTFGYCFSEVLRAVEIIGETNFIHSYNMKLRGSMEYARTIWNLKNYSSCDKLLSKINPEMTSKYISLSQGIAELKKKYPEIKASGDAEKLKDLQNEIATLTKRMQEIRKSKVKLDPQQVINKTRVLAAIADNNPSVLQEFVELIQDGTKENEALWKEKVNSYIFDLYEIEYDEKISERLNLVSSKYIGKILSADNRFRDGFKKIVGLIKANPTKSNEEIFDMLPQNIKTKEMFNALGIDYEKWSKFDESSSVKIQVELSVDEARKAAIEALEKEFNHVAFYSLPTEEVNKIFQALSKIGVKILSVETPVWSANETVLQTQTVMKLFKDDAPIKFDDLSLIMKIIKKAMNENDFWTKSTGNPEIDSYKDTVYTHLTKDRDQQYHTAKDLKEDTVVELEIRKTDMNNISHALFLGNHGACCTAVGTGCNQYSAPNYVMNKLVSAIEIVDNGDFVGNTMCYIALVDGVPSLVLDNIELKADYHNNDKIRDALMEYAKKLCAEIGKPDMPIYAGPYRHKLRMEDYEFKSHEMQIVGCSDNDEIYLDFITTGREITGNEVDNIKLFKIR